ncbi:WD40 repeat domain-containing protein [Kitasatospora sp. NPDC001660]
MKEAGLSIDSCTSRPLPRGCTELAFLLDQGGAIPARTRHDLGTFTVSGGTLQVAEPDRPDAPVVTLPARVGTVRIWNPATGAQVGGPLIGHSGEVRAMAAFTAADGSPHLASGGTDGTVRIWNPAPRTERTLPLADPVHVLAGTTGDGLTAAPMGGQQWPRLDERRPSRGAARAHRDRGPWNDR